MSTIGGPGGIGGPKGPQDPSGASENEAVGGGDGADVEIQDVSGARGARDVSEVREVASDPAIAQARGPASSSDIAALSAEIAAGRLTPQEAIDRLVADMAGPELDEATRADMREVLTDLIANDPHLSALVGRI